MSVEPGLVCETIPAPQPIPSPGSMPVPPVPWPGNVPVEDPPAAPVEPPVIDPPAHH
ncbi:hypothetical protein SAMN05428957_10428 [Oryzisolibacter propanilivorax]|uniref:Uncharacterized protein n=1 Tax=Oryzisolibacter propanilivorax TaxID=1527607 RepID=A0A1G9S0H1_9BURK|nr:hypothetical protein [Oryzisolibacter propanilivorax]SDM28999.1 hypothetical protein SAMN05428957_10428 [Oryzisolibacter propanilivorax]